jgi:hypothetical protein
MVIATGLVNMCSFYSAHVLPVPSTISSTGIICHLSVRVTSLSYIFPSYKIILSVFDNMEVPLSTKLDDP